MPERPLSYSLSTLEQLRQARVVGIIIIDAAKLIDANRFFLDLVGYTEEDLHTGKLSWRDMTPPEYAENDDLALKEFDSLGVCTPYEKDFVRRDGIRVPVLLVGLSVLESEPKQYVCYVVDRTKQRRADAALMQTARLASVGRLAATIAHEINNPLAATVNLLYLLQTSDFVKEEARGHLEQAQKQLARIAELTRNTLGFYKEMTFAATVNVSELIDQAALLYRPKIDEKRLNFAIRKEPALPVRAIAGEVRQLISNLLANAMDSVQWEGSVTIRARTARSWRDPNLIGVRITIFDDGPGVSYAERERIFEPFFTTKKDVGIGLGLWAARQIAERHGGTITLRSCTRAGKTRTAAVTFLPASGKVDATPVPTRRRFES
jgi:PAS domain S-box-containing protein